MLDRMKKTNKNLSLQYNVLLLHYNIIQYIEWIQNIMRSFEIANIQVCS